MIADDPVALILLAVLDEAHTSAVIADRERHGAPLTTNEAVTVASWCDAYADPNAACEILVARRYRGCQIAPMPPSRSVGRNGSKPEPFTPPQGYISRSAEPAAFARAIALTGWRHKSTWKAVVFPAAVAHAARIGVVPAAERLRLVQGGAR